MKKIFLIIFLILFSLFLIPQQVQAGVVPCGLANDDLEQPGDQTVPCQFCHFFVLFKNIVDFILFKIVPVLAILMIVIGGVIFFAAVGNPAKVSQAKSLFSSIAIGLVILYGAWLLINLFFLIIGVSEWTELREGWFKIDCP